MEVSGLGKRYRIPPPTIRARSRLARTWRLAISPFEYLRRSLRAPTEEETVWAIRDVSFSVQEGDVLGIIGRNGAGKSTLLRILSRITDPTSGKASVHGRLSSLLEVGTGFHPELTGRENVFMNGAILGMSRQEITSKFDEIVEFAGVERFIDTPVKRYSSGMKVRLGFAVAAHLDSEILMIDEVLAVGDVSFQRRCLGKMGEIARGGRTVLFVSHSMAAIENLCSRGIVLDGGRKVFEGTASGAVASYLRLQMPPDMNLEDREDRDGTGEIRVVAVEFRDADGAPMAAAACGQTIQVHLIFERSPDADLSAVQPGVLFRTQMDVPVFTHHSRLSQVLFDEIPLRGAFVLEIERLPLPPSSYRLDYSLMHDGRYLDHLSSAAELTVVGGNFFAAPEVPPSTHGLVLVDGKWRMASNHDS